MQLNEILQPSLFTQSAKLPNAFQIQKKKRGGLQFFRRQNIRIFQVIVVNLLPVKILK